MQWLIILLVIFLCLSSFFAGKRKIRKRQVHKIETAEKVIHRLAAFEGENRACRILCYLRQIDPFAFEELLLTAFEKKGYRIKRNSRYTGDGGIDGRVYRDGELYLVQAKRYKSYVSVRHLEDFLRLVKETKEAKGGYFIHTGKTGKETYSLYRGTPVEIISGDKLINLILTDK